MVFQNTHKLPEIVNILIGDRVYDVDMDKPIFERYIKAKLLCGKRHQLERERIKDNINLLQCI